jgi:autotransporter translocation and assembly factor TamB
VNLEKFTPTGMNLELTAKSLPVEVPGTLSALLNADIHITGSHRSAAANGKIVIQQGVYYKDVKINLLKLATARRRSIAPPSQPISMPFFDTVKLDVTVGYRQPFAVQNNLAELEINPDLHIGGTLARPVVDGRAQVSSGTITFQKKTFEVKKGVVDFTNPYKTEAHIDIASETTIRTWTITLTIKGTPENLDLQLSSVPSATNSDILSLILFGRTAEELAGGQSAAKVSTSQILTGMIADTFGEDIKKNTGIDIFQVETDNSGTNRNAAGVKVTVGKHLSNRMTVKYAVETKNGEVVQRAITEYKLLENILVSGFQDTQGIYGTELVFRIEFR